jgi:hypothetical protein
MNNRTTVQLQHTNSLLSGVDDTQNYLLLARAAHQYTTHKKQTKHAKLSSTTGYSMAAACTRAISPMILHRHRFLLLSLLIEAEVHPKKGKLLAH